MINKTKLRRFSFFLAALILFIGGISMPVSAKTDLTVEGNVLGYDLLEVRSFSTFIFMLHPLLVKVTKVLDGKEKSEYIKVLMYSLNETYAKENFGLDKVSTFQLERNTFCDGKIKNLIYPGLTIENGQVVKTSQTFTLVPDIEKKSLPLNKKIPCYIVAR